MTEESKCCNEMIKKHFNKKLVMTKEDNNNFKNSTKCWNWKCWKCDQDYIDNNSRVRNHYHITGKYRGSAHRDFNINLKLNYKIPVVFHNIKNYDSHLIMPELGKFYLKINVVSNGLGKYLSLNNKLDFSDSFLFVSSSLDSLVKTEVKIIFSI